jgi:GTP-binding protein
MRNLPAPYQATGGDEQQDMTPLFEAIMQYVPEAPNKANQPFRMQIVNLGYDNFLGRMGIGRVYE